MRSVKAEVWKVIGSQLMEPQRLGVDLGLIWVEAIKKDVIVDRRD